MLLDVQHHLYTGQRTVVVSKQSVYNPHMLLAPRINIVNVKYVAGNICGVMLWFLLLRKAGWVPRQLV